MKTALALLLALTVTSSADAGTRCRSTTMGSTTWTTCEIRRARPNAGPAVAAQPRTPLVASADLWIRDR